METRTMIYVMALLVTGTSIVYGQQNCNPPCASLNGGSCQPSNNTCSCPSTYSGSTCELPPLPDNGVTLQTEYCIINGNANNWISYVNDQNVTAAVNTTIRIHTGNSSAAGSLWGKTYYLSSTVFPTSKHTLNIRGVVNMADLASAGSIFTVLLSSSNAVFKPPKSGTYYKYGIDERSFTGIATIFDGTTGSVHATVSTYARQVTLSNTTTYLRSSCEGNVTAMLQGRFTFAIKINWTQIWVTIYKVGQPEVTCLNQIELPSSIVLQPNTSTLLGMTGCCGVSPSSLVEISEFRLYTTNSGGCSTEKLNGTSNLVWDSSWVVRMVTGNAYCPIRSQGLIGSNYYNRTMPIGCDPNNNLFLNNSQPVKCVARNDAVCEPVCENGGTCVAGTCQCAYASHQQPNCRFIPAYLPYQVVAFFPLNLDTFYVLDLASSNKSNRRLLDKSNSPLQPYAVLGPLVYFPTATLCSGCTRQPYLRTSPSSATAGQADRAVVVSFTKSRTTVVPDPTTTPTTIMVFVYCSGGSCNGQQILTWKRRPPFTAGPIPSFLTIGTADATSQLWVAYNATGGSDSSFVTINANMSVPNSNATLLAISFDPSNRTVTMWFPLFNDAARKAVELVGFEPPGPSDGEQFQIGFHGGLVANHTWQEFGGFSYACFGVFNGQPSLNDSRQYADACFYDSGNSKVPALVVPPQITTTTTAAQTTTAIITTAAPNTDEPSTAATSTASPKYEFAVTCTWHVGGNLTLENGTALDTSTWYDELNDTDSDLYKMAAEVFQDALYRLYCELAGYTDGCSVTVTDLRPGSIIADYIVALRSLTQLTEDQIQKKVAAAFGNLKLAGTTPLKGIDVSQSLVANVEKVAVTYTPPSSSSSSSSSSAGKTAAKPTNGVVKATNNVATAVSKSTLAILFCSLVLTISLQML